METPAIFPDSERSLALAVLARLLKTGLRLPSAQTLEVLTSPLAQQARQRAASLLGGGLRAAVDRLDREPIPDLDSLIASHTRLFGHSLRGQVCPYGTEYGRRALLQQAHELADLTGFYAAFGFGVAARERADHIAVQLEFLELLALKQVWALESDQQEIAGITFAAERRFLAEHLGRFGRAFACSLEEAADSPLYRSLADILGVFLESVCAGAGVAVGPDVLELTPADPDGVPMACGPDPELVHLGSAER